MTTYTAVYPTAHSDTYVKATSKYSTSYWHYFATDPSKSLTGTGVNNQWISVNGAPTNQRFHIDLGEAKIVRQIYYENGHESGAGTNAGCRAFTMQGSNEASSFAELTYATNTGWTDLTTASSEFDQHTASDIADPKYILVTNTTAYRYYALKFSTNWGYGSYMWLRRLVMMTEDGYTPGGGFFPRIMIF
jgi:hypothetical protein